MEKDKPGYFGKRDIPVFNKFRRNFSFLACISLFALIISAYLAYIFIYNLQSLFMKQRPVF